MNTTITQLRSTLVSILAMHPIYGERRTSGEIIDSINQQRGYGDRVLDLSLSWDRAWTVGADGGIARA